MTGRLELGIDIGGTFTDFIAVDTLTDRIYTWKTLTTPDAPARAVLAGIQALQAEHQFDILDVKKLVHATTLITNALIERKGAPTAMLTTAGFADLIEIGREVRYDLYDIFLQMPASLVPAERRFEIPERIDHTGDVVNPLDSSAFDSIATQLRESGAGSLAVCFLHSYANPEHEQAAGAAIGARLPDLPVSQSANVAGEIREFERFSTTVANAYVQPLAAHYLTDMRRQLDDLGVDAPLQIMLSNGGTTNVDEAVRLPIRLVESGPAAGALIAAHYARALGEEFVLAFDMGGTTAKLCAIDQGQPTVGSGMEVARIHRFKRGSGLPIRAPSVELIEIGAGGGSIARVDDLHLLTVGPDSAGADPGPACYGRGGTLPTVTDADLLLGYLNPDYFLGGAMALDAELASAAINATLADEIGMDTLEVAAGIHDLVNEMMTTAAGVYIAERGSDPRQYTLVATGGAGPVHAVEVARKLGIRRVIVPHAAGVASAGGLLVAPPRLDIARSAPSKLDDLNWQDIDELYRNMEAEALATLAAMQVPHEAIRIERGVDARYVNQGHEISFPLPSSFQEANDARDAIAAAFDEQYRRLFGRTVSGVPIECITWRTTVRGRDGTLPAINPEASRSHASSRTVHFRRVGLVETPVYHRLAIPTGRDVAGPAVIEEAQSTTIIGPGDHFRVDESGCILIHIGEEATP